MRTRNGCESTLNNLASWLLTTTRYGNGYSSYEIANIQTSLYIKQKDNFWLGLARNYVEDSRCLHAHPSAVLISALGHRFLIYLFS